ncbi:trypsin-like peptidase domain-containing protein [Nostoc sp. FACHB-190]|uniref:trypsin-like peptidase domain-containing protein n=1 Tax=Nostoc sp. FACHB-190 TaxID=2692838 RepID=UPI001687B9BB|nr:trypsin-like peptidase domain-containing protein [Nostoc sp. FACHB-190]MBD2300085.1 trypsin-like peptidase domain-containing protein [Nostoc sp. FACHB-190]
MKKAIKLTSLISLFLLFTLLKSEKIIGLDKKNKIKFVCDETLLATQAKWLNNNRVDNIIFWRDQNWISEYDTTLRQKCIDVSAAFQKAYQEDKLKRIISSDYNGRKIICASQKGKQCDYPLYSLLPGENTAVEVAQQLFKRIFDGNTSPLRHSDFSLDIERFLFGNEIVKKNQISCPIKITSISKPSDIEKSSTLEESVRVKENAKQFTIKIDALESQGSGVIFARQGNNYCILTAKHNISTSIKHNKSIRIITPDGMQYEAQNPRVAPDDIDLAVLEFVSNKKPGYEIATIGNAKQTYLLSKPQVYIIGFPASFARKNIEEALVSEGKFDAASKKSFDITYTPSDSESAATFGMSGGAVLDSQGILIGIHGLGEPIGSKTTIFRGVAINADTLSKMASSLGLNLQAPKVEISTNNLSPPRNTEETSLVGGLIEDIPKIIERIRRKFQDQNVCIIEFNSQTQKVERIFCDVRS